MAHFRIPELVEASLGPLKDPNYVDKPVRASQDIRPHNNIGLLRNASTVCSRGTPLPLSVGTLVEKLLASNLCLTPGKVSVCSVNRSAFLGVDGGYPIPLITNLQLSNALHKHQQNTLNSVLNHNKNKLYMLMKT